MYVIYVKIIFISAYFSFHEKLFLIIYNKLNEALLTPLGLETT